MDLRGIFGLFGYPDDAGDGNYSDDEKKINESLDVFKETPYFKIGMFCKMIRNGNNFTQQMKKFFSSSDDPIDLTGVGEASDIMMYNRALSWIQECDLKKENWKLALHEHKERGLLDCLKKAIKFFESIEEYETCSFLKSLQDCVEEIYP